MANYEVLIARKALKEAERIPKNYLNKINQAIKDLELNPFPAGVKKLVGSQNSYRIRIGDYRVIYLREGNVIKIISIMHRREAYR